jgi:hypothetical protein
MQDLTQAAAMGCWSRDPGGYKSTSNSDGSTSVTAPKSAFMTRYGHLFDFQPDTVTIRTNHGYMLRFTDSTQQLDVYAPNMVGLVGQMKFTGTDFQFYPSNSFNVSTGATTLSSNTNTLKAALSNVLTAIASNDLNSPIVRLGPTAKANDPVVRLGDLATVCNLIMAIYDVHTHICASPGSPTTPPIIPMILTASASSNVFSA